MLEPQDRQTILEALRPPSGYNLDFCIGTTYSLDLVTLLTVPLAFTRFQAESDDGEPNQDPTALLQALVGYAKKMAIFCQVGRISLPQKYNRLYVFMEDSIVEVVPAIGSFHPKVWILRLCQKGHQEPFYRLLCATRNLTNDRCWDTLLLLDGEYRPNRAVQKRNEPVSRFLRALPQQARYPLHSELATRLDKMANELMRVDFQLPLGFKDLVFWPLGVTETSSWPFRGKIDRLMIISPFLEANALERLGSLGRGSLLVSRTEPLQTLSSEALASFQHVYTLRTDADIDQGDNGSDEKTKQTLLTGLHAKLFVADSGSEARIWTGSANATNAAFAGNTEFLVELIGPKSKFGITSLMQQVEGEARFSNLLEDYHPDETPRDPNDSIERLLDKKFRETIAIIAKSEPIVEVAIADTNSETYSLIVKANPHILSTLSEDVIIWCRPISVVDESAYVKFELRAGAQVAMLPRISIDSLTPFFAFRISGSIDHKHSQTRDCVLTLPLQGDLPDRCARVFHSVIDSKERVLKYLLYLLDIELPPNLADTFEDGLLVEASEGNQAIGPMAPLLEALMRALDQDPERLDQTCDALDQLRKTEEGRNRLPEGLNSIWEPIWQARQRLKK